jgi:predicted O-linked N-acetylglucosamine transferase (SPINDLY family)
LLLKLLGGLLGAKRRAAPPAALDDRSPEEGLRNEAEALERAGRLDDALERYRAWAHLDPRAVDAWLGAGNVLADRWSIPEALEAYRAALRLRPDSPTILSGILFFSHYLTPADPATLFDLHRRYGEMMRRRHPPRAGATAVAPDPGRRIRVGYVSPNFSRHSVGYFIAPVIAAHDRRRFEVYCYYTHRLSDDATARIRASADGWRDVATASDDALDALIRDDRIDVLVDLSGHCKGNRLAVFARKPASLQVTWLGYPDTTGLDAIDVRITDGIADPAPEADARHTERLWRVDGTFLAYEPPPDSPAIGARRGGMPVVFGSFNHAAKLNEPTITLWAEILARVPESRLVLKSGLFDHAVTRDRVVECFERHGVAVERIEVEGWRADRASHLSLYGEIDIALDTYPYNGTTTTCESLWMGVPVVSRAGRVHMSRVGTSILRCAGLDELVADSDAQYVERAVALARDERRRTVLRATLRDRLRASPLLDHAGFTQRLEQCYLRCLRTGRDDDRAD